MAATDASYSVPRTGTQTATPRRHLPRFRWNCWSEPPPSRQKHSPAPPRPPWPASSLPAPGVMSCPRRTCSKPRDMCQQPTAPPVIVTHGRFRFGSHKNSLPPPAPASLVGQTPARPPPPTHNQVEAKPVVRPPRSHDMVRTRYAAHHQLASPPTPASCRRFQPTDVPMAAKGVWHTRRGADNVVHTHAHVCVDTPFNDPVAALITDYLCILPNHGV